MKSNYFLNGKFNIYADFVNDIARLKFNQLNQEEYTKALDGYNVLTLTKRI